MPRRRLAHQGRMKVQQMQDEVVGMLCFELEASELLLREICQIEGDDQVGSAVNCSGNHMTVVGVGKIDARNQMLKASDEAIAHMGIHERSRAIQLFRCQVGTVLPDAADPFVMYR